MAKVSGFNPIQIRGLSESRRFYSEELKCSVITADQAHLSFSLLGQSIDCQLSPHLGGNGSVARRYNFASGRTSVVPHCTVQLPLRDWRVLRAWIARRGLKFTEDTASFVVFDPSGNAIEAKLRPDDVKRLLRIRNVWAAALGIVLLLILLSGLALRLSESEVSNSQQQLQIAADLGRLAPR